MPGIFGKCVAKARRTARPRKLKSLEISTSYLDLSNFRLPTNLPGVAAYLSNNPPSYLVPRRLDPLPLKMIHRANDVSSAPIQLVPATLRGVRLGLSLLDGKPHQRRVAINDVDELAVGHRDEEAGNDTQVDNQQRAHRWRFAQRQQ